MVNELGLGNYSFDKLMEREVEEKHFELFHAGASVYVERRRTPAFQLYLGFSPLSNVDQTRSVSL